ncbi:MAG: hypothetical protein O7A03_03805, partial [Alphaproteobacteria bacterium]|nr:hypothetical protein [Alphaproteobacteria bacterium]
MRVRNKYVPSFFSVFVPIFLVAFAGVLAMSQPAMARVDTGYFDMSDLTETAAPSFGRAVDGAVDITVEGVQLAGHGFGGFGPRFGRRPFGGPRFGGPRFGGPRFGGNRPSRFNRHQH